MKYEKEILFVLNEAGKKGLSIKKITRHIFNNHNGLFEELSFEDVHKTVGGFLRRNSKKRGSVVERTEKNGVYRIKASIKSSQLELIFKDDNDSQDKKEVKIDKDKSELDTSLSLF